MTFFVYYCYVCSFLFIGFGSEFVRGGGESSVFPKRLDLFPILLVSLLRFAVRARAWVPGGLPARGGEGRGLECRPRVPVPKQRGRAERGAGGNSSARG